VRGRVASHVARLRAAAAAGASRDDDDARGRDAHHRSTIRRVPLRLLWR
jgi:hypothetical protein